MRNLARVFFALCSAAVVFAACNSNGNVSTPAGVGTYCGPPPNKLEVLYPKPGARNVNPAIGNFYVSTSGLLPPSNNFDFAVAQSNGAQTLTSNFFQIKASQVPTPHPSPSYPNAVYYATSVQPPSYIIGPDQSVSLLWNDGGTGCTPHYLVSSFKTHG